MGVFSRCLRALRPQRNDTDHLSTDVSCDWRHPDARRGAQPDGCHHAQGQACARTCLRTTLDAYLETVIKHDPAPAPLMIGSKGTPMCNPGCTTTIFAERLLGVATARVQHTTRFGVVVPLVGMPWEDALRHACCPASRWTSAPTLSCGASNAADTMVVWLYPLIGVQPCALKP